MKIRLILWLTAVFLLLAACGSQPAELEPTEPAEEVSQEEAEIEEETAVVSTPEEIEEEDDATATPNPTDTPQSTPAPLPTRPNNNENLTTTDSGLQYEILEAGEGVKPEVGDIVVVQYVGSLEDGTIFDSSIARGEPAQFALGQGVVIPGWDEGIALMNIGDKMRLVIPPTLAYGTAGAGGVIPPNATLTFEVELLGVVEPTPTPLPPDPPTAVNESDYSETEAGMLFFVLQEGDGDQPQLGDSVAFHFSGWLEDGTSIGTSYPTGQPVDIILGQQSIMPGWDNALTQMNVGEITQFILPPELGLGEVGSPPAIPPNSTLIFEIELIEILPPPPTPQAINPDEIMTTESGLQYVVLEEGDGEVIAEGETAVVHYRGWFEDGTQFDSSYDRNQPFDFQVGIGAVISGWDEGVSLMRVGDKMQFIIPPDLAYGEGGTRGIPPESTLIFEVELLEIR